MIVFTIIHSNSCWVYTPLYMENINQEQAPKVLSIIEQQKAAAAEFVANKIDSIQNEQGISVLAAARQVYEEVKGQAYREEQAVAKLLEYLHMQNELSLRRSEIETFSPCLSRYTDVPVANTNTPAANDERYSVAA